MKARRRREPAPRDQHESAFTAILAGLVDRVPGARAAALVDFEGETVDYAGRLAPYPLRLAAAHWRIVIDAAASRGAAEVRWIAVRAARASYLVHALPEGYALVLVLARAAGFVGWRRAVAACGRALGEEAGWSWAGMPPPRPAWYPAEVTADARRRPLAVRLAGRSRPVEILGALAGGLARRERGWRVRLDTGVEATLVREPSGTWYADEPVDAQPGQAAHPSQARGVRRREQSQESQERRERAVETASSRARQKTR